MRLPEVGDVGVADVAPLSVVFLLVVAMVLTYVVVRAKDGPKIRSIRQVLTKSATKGKSLDGLGRYLCNHKTSTTHATQYFDPRNGIGAFHVPSAGARNGAFAH
mgnify:CR=1 FL=1